MHHPVFSRPTRAPRHYQRLALLCLYLVSLVLAASVVGGCGGKKKSATTAAQTTEAVTTEAATISTTESTTTTAGLPQDFYAKRELSTIPLSELQKCPENGGSQWDVLYHGQHTIVNCGTGSAVARAGGTTIEAKNGWCALYKHTGSVSFYFGAAVQGSGAFVFNHPEIAYGPSRIDISFGIKPHQSAMHDGTYVDTPVSDLNRAKYGMNIIVAGNGKLWANDGFHHTTTVTLKKGRMQGSFTATAHTGGSMTGTFRCGDHILTD